MSKIEDVDISWVESARNSPEPGEIVDALCFYGGSLWISRLVWAPRAGWLHVPDGVQGADELARFERLRVLSVGVVLAWRVSRLLAGMGLVDILGNVLADGAEEP